MNRTSIGWLRLTHRLLRSETTLRVDRFPPRLNLRFLRAEFAATFLFKSFF